MAWNLVERQDTATIRDSIALLQRTSTGYANMTVNLLKNKMKQPNNDPNDPNANTSHHCLRLYAYIDQSKLLVSAFFFSVRANVRRRMPCWSEALTMGDAKQCRCEDR